LKIREMVSGEEARVFALVMCGFDEVVRPDFSAEGVAEFNRAARSFIFERPAGHCLRVAERGGRIVGMLDVRDHSHVCLFFVERDVRGTGVGRALLQAAIEGASQTGERRSTITVNSSTWAVKVYERLGFDATGPVSEQNGIRFVPMSRRL
jgi:GNAT superfamily N-acetyltransferase